MQQCAVRVSLMEAFVDQWLSSRYIHQLYSIFFILPIFLIPAALFTINIVNIVNILIPPIRVCIVCVIIFHIPSIATFNFTAYPTST